MRGNITTIRLLAIAYARGRLSRSEYLQKRGQQISALEFGQPQPPLETDEGLMEMLNEESTSLKDARLKYFDGRDDVAAAARMRLIDSEHHLSDAESREYRSANHLVIVACALIGLALVLQVAGYIFQKYQQARDENQLRLLLGGDSVNVARELNIDTGDSIRLSVEEYDELAKSIPVAIELKRLLAIDLDRVPVDIIIELTDSINNSSKTDLRTIASTSWFLQLVYTLNNYSEQSEKALVEATSGEPGAGSETGASAAETTRAIQFLSRKRNAYASFYADLAEMLFEYSQD